MNGTVIRANISWYNRGSVPRLLCNNMINMMIHKIMKHSQSRIRNKRKLPIRETNK